eukprot:g565.t1
MLANESRMKGNDERKKTMLIMDMKRIAALKGKYKRNKQNLNPYINYLEAQLKHSKKRIRISERRLIHQTRMCNLAEAQWTVARSFNDKMKLERDNAKNEVKEAIKWKPIASERQATIAEMSETLLQLRIALHIGKKQHNLLDRRGREALKKAEILQKKLNKHLSSQTRNSNNRSITSPSYNGVNNLEEGYYGNFHYDNQSTPNYSMSRGNLTTAGSSVAGLSPPSSPIRRDIGSNNSTLYFGPIRNINGRAITPIPPINRVQLTPNKSTNLFPRPVSPDADEKYVSGYLDGFQAKPMRRNRAGKR